MDGATAVGGGDLTVVTLVESDVLLDVESVTIVSANAIVEAVTITIATNIFFMVLCFSYGFIMKTART
jgi:ribosomal protein RSM22 (predicted rRNA methylase)